MHEQEKGGFTTPTAPAQVAPAYFEGRVQDNESISWACRQGRPWLCRPELHCSRTHDPEHQAEIKERLKLPVQVGYIFRPKGRMMLPQARYKRYGYHKDDYVVPGLMHSFLLVRDRRAVERKRQEAELDVIEQHAEHRGDVGECPLCTPPVVS